MEPLTCRFKRLLERRLQPTAFADRSSQAEWQAPELPLDDERILVLDAGPPPPNEFG